MDYKMVVSDLDGTMFGGDLTPHPRNFSAIKKLIETGRVFAIATGRPTYSALAVAKKLGLDRENQYVICFQGGIVAEAATGRELFSIPLAEEYALHIIRTARDKNATVIAYINGLPYTHYYDREAAEYANQVGVTLTVDEHFEDNYKGTFSKVIMRGAPENLKKIEGELMRWVEGKAACVYSAPNLLEYFNLDVSKGKAVLGLGEKLGIKPGEIIAIGDYYNDLSMITAAGLGVAICGSPAEVRAAASYVTEKTAEEGAVSEVIEKFVFGE